MVNVINGLLCPKLSYLMVSPFICNVDVLLSSCIPLQPASVIDHDVRHIIVINTYSGSDLAHFSCHHRFKIENKSLSNHKTIATWN